MNRLVSVLLLLLCSLAGCSNSDQTSTTGSSTQSSLASTAEAGFTQLTLKDFEPVFGDDTTWREEHGEIICSGTPKSYMHSRETYGNFNWKGEFRFSPDVKIDEASRKYPNTGFMLQIIEPHQVWPRSLEIQGRFDEMAQIKSNGGVPNLTIEDSIEAREAARKPIGEWNSIEIVSKDGAVTSFLNGQQICHSEPGELKEGFIGLQSELFEVHFRNLRIRRDEATLPSATTTSEAAQ